MGQSLDRDNDHLHNTGHNGHGAHVQVAAIFLQAIVQGHADQAFRALHDKWRDPKAGDLLYHRAMEFQITLPQPDHTLLRSEEPEDPGCAHRLGQDGGQGRPLHSHAKQEDEDGIQHNVDHRSDQHRQHGSQSASLAADEGV